MAMAVAMAVAMAMAVAIANIVQRCNHLLGAAFSYMFPHDYKSGSPTYNICLSLRGLRAAPRPARAAWRTGTEAPREAGKAQCGTLHQICKRR